MGMIINGQWQENTDTFIKEGAFVRQTSTFNDNLSDAVISDISNGTNRYILIASLSCPWSHRTVLTRCIKNLQHLLPLHLAGGPRIEGYGLYHQGPLHQHFKTPPVHVHQLYTSTDKHYSGRSSVPILWDTLDNKIISNQSALIMRGLDQIPSTTQFTLVPANLKDQIDELNKAIHSNLSNAVYRAGLAQNQSAYNEAVDQVFTMLDQLEIRLHEKRFLFGELLTETDLCLFATLVRFDTVYATHFRCTLHRLVDYPNLWRYTREIYNINGIAHTVDFEVIMEGYYANDASHNPFSIIAQKPEIDWSFNPGS